MFSNYERCLYQSNQLGDVICQLRFPEILSIGANLPVALQEQIRHLFPQFSAKQEPTKNTGRKVINYQFVSADGVWQLNLSNNFIALTCNRYVDWNNFTTHLDAPLTAFIQLYKPAYFERIGLRYINCISRKSLEMTDVPFRELIQPQYLGLMTDDEISEASFNCCSTDVDVAIRGGCRAKIHTGPGRVRRNGVDDGEIKYIFDLDLYTMGNIPVNCAAEALETIHAQAFPIFRGAITQVLHEAMNPMDL